MTNEPLDRHVLAVAVGAGARTIVTANLRHFPEGSAAPFGIEVRSPDDFLVDLFHTEPDTMREVIIRQARALRYGDITIGDVLNNVGRDTPQFAELTREYLKQSPRYAPEITTY